MKTDKQWESRARELGIHDEMHVPGALLPSQIQPALQLGREMAEEARAEQSRREDDYRVELLPVVRQRAADERAEEIAYRIADIMSSHTQDYVDATNRAAWIARSTITKPKEPPTAAEVVAEMRWTEAAIRADEREKIAKRIEACEGQWPNAFGEPVMCVATAAAVARAGEPKTREQVLEDALRGLLGDPRLKNLGGAPADAARRALDWRPDPTT